MPRQAPPALLRVSRGDFRNPGRVSDLVAGLAQVSAGRLHGRRQEAAKHQVRALGLPSHSARWDFAQGSGHQHDRDQVARDQDDRGPCELPCRHGLEDGLHPAGTGGHGTTCGAGTVEGLSDLPDAASLLQVLPSKVYLKAIHGRPFPSHRGRPAASPRLVAGLLYLQHAYRLSDEAVVARWVENPYYQHFIGETFFQHRPRIDPSLLTRWRNRIGEEGAEWLLTKTFDAGRASGAVDDDSLSRVAIDTTVMEKTIAHPTDALLYEKARGRLVDLASEAGVTLRQNYNRLGSRLAMTVEHRS